MNFLKDLVNKIPGKKIAISFNLINIVRKIIKKNQIKKNAKL